MDELAELLGARHEQPLTRTRGTVAAINTDGTLTVVMDGSPTGATVRIGRSCNPRVGDRVQILKDATQWTAVAVVGGENVMSQVPLATHSQTIRGIPLTIYKWGRLCYLLFDGNINATVAAWSAYGAISNAAFRPIAEASDQIGYHSNSSINGLARFMVAVNGEISSAIETQSGARVRVVCAYISAS